MNEATKKLITERDSLLRALKACQIELSHWHQHAHQSRPGYTGSTGANATAGVLKVARTAITNAEASKP